MHTLSSPPLIRHHHQQRHCNVPFQQPSLMYFLEFVRFEKRTYLKTYYSYVFNLQLETYEFARFARCTSFPLLRYLSTPTCSSLIKSSPSCSTVLASLGTQRIAPPSTCMQATSHIQILLLVVFNLSTVFPCVLPPPQPPPNTTFPLGSIDYLNLQLDQWRQQPRSPYHTHPSRDERGSAPSQNLVRCISSLAIPCIFSSTLSSSSVCLIDLFV